MLLCLGIKSIFPFFSNNHLIVTVPPYRDPNSLEAIVVNILVKCGSKCSEPRSLTLKPAQPVVKLNGVVPTAGTNRYVTPYEPPRGVIRSRI